MFDARVALDATTGDPFEAAIRVARWLTVIAMIPIGILAAVQAELAGTTTRWLVAETTVIVVGSALILSLYRRPPLVQAAAISTVLTAVAWLAVAHYGPLIDVGLLIALSCVCWTYFFGRAGMIGATTMTIAFLALTAWGSLSGALDFANRSPSTPATPDAWLRTALTEGAAVLYLTALVHGMQSRYHAQLARTTENERCVTFLSRATALLAESLDVDEIPGRLARLAVPFLGDWCAIFEVGPGGSLRVIADVHRYPEKAPVLSAQCRGAMTDPDARRWMTSLAGEQQPTLVPVLTEDVARARFGPGTRERLRVLGADTWMAVPVVTRGASRGVMIFGAASRRFGTVELHLATELARRAAIAIDNAGLYRQAVDAIRLRDEFLTVASHELRTPLTSMLLAARSLRGDLTEPRAAARAEVVERQARRLAQLVGDMLDVSRMQTPLALHREELDLVQLTRNVVGQLDHTLRRSGSSVFIDAPESVRGAWDRVRLERTITHLLDNAVKFGGAAPIEISISEHDEHARIAIRDRGIGIPPEQLTRLFERFERGVSSRHYGGLGLGLYLTKRIVEAHGGSVEVHSDAIEGTTFTIELPTHASKDVSAPTPRAQREATAAEHPPPV